VVGVVLANKKRKLYNGYCTIIHDKPTIFYPIQSLINMGIKNILIVSDECKQLELIIDGNFDVNIEYMLGSDYVKGILEWSNDDVIFIDGNLVTLEEIKLNSPPHIYLSHSACPKNNYMCDFYGEQIRDIKFNPEKQKSKLSVNMFVLSYSDLKVEGKNIFSILRTFLPTTHYSFINNGLEITSSKDLYEASIVIKNETSLI
jgi:hypothetical protein